MTALLLLVREAVEALGVGANADVEPAKTRTARVDDAAGAFMMRNAVRLTHSY